MGNAYTHVHTAWKSRALLIQWDFVIEAFAKEMHLIHYASKLLKYVSDVEKIGDGGLPIL